MTKTKPLDPAPIHLNSQQLADRLHKSRWWVYTNHHKLGIKSLKAGRELLFPISSVELWEKEHLA